MHGIFTVFRLMKTGMLIALWAWFCMERIEIEWSSIAIIAGYIVMFFEFVVGEFFNADVAENTK